MQSLPSHVNPFALMLDPQAVIAKIESSERLGRLHRRVCRPLDKPLLGGTTDMADDAADAQSAPLHPDADAEGDPDMAANDALAEAGSAHPSA